MHAVYFYLSKVKRQARLLILFGCTFVEGYKVKQGNEQSVSNAWGRRIWWKRGWGTKSFHRNQAATMLPHHLNIQIYRVLCERHF